jgi:hypothetical protein
VDAEVATEDRERGRYAFHTKDTAAAATVDNFEELHAIGLIMGQDFEGKLDGAALLRFLALADASKLG